MRRLQRPLQELEPHLALCSLWLLDPGPAHATFGRLRVIHTGPAFIAGQFEG